MSLLQSLYESFSDDVHPQKDENGREVFIRNPSTHSPIENFSDKSKVATVTPLSKNVPDSLNGVKFTKFDGSNHDWEKDEGINHSIKEPHISGNRRIATGIIMKEPDGRYWVHEPTNHFADTLHSFPKGKLEKGLSMQANALKETYEETGLKARIIKHLGDVERSTATARYYLGERVGGHPSHMGWESQSVKLIPKERLKDYLNVHYDHQLVDKLN